MTSGQDVPNLTLRSAVPLDVHTILGFIKDLASYEQLMSECEATEERILATLFGAKPVAECTLALVGPDPAGYVVYFPNYSSFLAKPGLFVEDLYVRPQFRKRGIGRALLNHVVKIANQRGSGRVDWTVLEWNEPAIDFYQSIGAKMVEDWRVFRLSGADLDKFGKT